MKKFSNKKQKGFSVLAVILVIVAVIVAIGVWALSGQTNTNNSGTSSADIQANAIINDSAAIKLAFDNLIINGATVSSITFVPNTASATNMLDTTTGIQVPKVNANSVRTSPGSTEGYWIYNPTGFKGYNVGLNTADQTILVAGIKAAVCQRINYILTGSTNVPVVFGASNATLTAGATPTAPTSTASIDLAGVLNLPGWTAGCFSNGATTGGGPDDTIFFRILKVN